MAATIPYQPVGSYTPSPSTYSSVFGGIPGATNTPNMAASTQFNLPSATASNISSELAGVLSPGTQNLLQNKAAAYGVNTGMPWTTGGNTLPLQNLLDNMGLTSENLAHQGITDYSQFNPATIQADVSQQNAVNAAAPNPQASSQYAQQLFDKYLAQQSKAGKPAPSGEFHIDTQGNFTSGDRNLYNQSVSNWW